MPVGPCPSRRGSGRMRRWAAPRSAAPGPRLHPRGSRWPSSPPPRSCRSFACPSCSPSSRWLARPCCDDPRSRRPAPGSPGSPSCPSPWRSRSASSPIPRSPTRGPATISSPARWCGGSPRPPASWGRSPCSPAAWVAGARSGSSCRPTAAWHSSRWRPRCWCRSSWWPVRSWRDHSSARSSWGSRRPRRSSRRPSWPWPTRRWRRLPTAGPSSAGEPAASAGAGRSSPRR